ncbi:hypothetical protein pdam_00015945 [Pocillopora damicornis]|uniref:G-protein coupled receptors family 1 profile domain-containing protein n=1 Tax=Pocillopora damicornis TaxID=46731 RepID=A0A3M6THA4_POCDA|nr:hypothetical protein pdam_00015945 [Pocillopora damicornis]
MTVNEKMNSSQYPYEACLIPALDEKLQHQIRDIRNYVVLPLDMIMAATSLILNTVICMTVIGTRSLRHPSLLLLCSLAVTDLLWALATLIYYTFVLRDPHMCPENGEEVVLVGFLTPLLLIALKMLSEGLVRFSGTSSDPSQEKCGSPLIKVTLTKLSISNLRHAFTLN